MTSTFLPLVVSCLAGQAQQMNQDIAYTIANPSVPNHVFGFSKSSKFFELETAVIKTQYSEGSLVSTINICARVRTLRCLHLSAMIHVCVCVRFASTLSRTCVSYIYIYTSFSHLNHFPKCYVLLVYGLTGR